MKAKFVFSLAVLFFVLSLLGCAACAPAASGAGGDQSVLTQNTTGSAAAQQKLSGADGAGKTGDQSAFLQDMADGVTARLKASDAEPEGMSDDEFIAYYTKLVSCELDEIGKYADVRFADERFDELSHAYLDACRMQLSALNYYKNEALHDALWNSGRTARAGIIVYMYEQYDLPITSDQVSSYRTASYSVSYSIDPILGGNVASDAVAENDDLAANDSDVISSNKPELTGTTVSYGYLDHTVFSEYWHEGVYRCGTDFKPGEYCMLSLYSAFDHSQPSGNADGFKSSGRVVAAKLSLEKGQYVKIDDSALLVHASEVNMKKLDQYGIFEVGKDLPAGEYKITSLSNEYKTKLLHMWGISGAYQVFSSEPFGAYVQSERLFEKQKYLTLRDGQYIAIVNAKLTFVG